MSQRIRTIKPEFFRHEGLFDLEQETGLPIRVAFAGLWTCCDREGRFSWRPRTLKAMILPHDTLDFARVLDALLTRGFVIKYRVGEEDYGLVITFKKHQVINNRESDSTLPAPGQQPLPLQSSQLVDVCVTREARVPDASGTPLVHAQVEGKGKEGKGKDQDQHACGALRNWFSIKAKLQSHLSEQEFKLWVRPLFLLRVMSDNSLLLALPPNGRIVESARLRKELLLSLVREAGHSGFNLTKYPDDYERERLRKEHPEFYEQMFGKKSEGNDVVFGTAKNAATEQLTAVAS